MRKFISCFVIVQLVCLTLSKDLPSTFKKCRRSDPDLNGCLKVAIQEAFGLVSKGIPELNFPPMEPLHLDSMVIGSGTGPVQVVQNFKDVSVYNISKLLLNSVNVKVSDTHFLSEFDGTVELITFKATYQLNGRVLILPIVGKGLCTLELHNVKFKLNSTGLGIEKKGKMYITIKDVHASLNPARVGYNFENLFNGDKELGAAMNKVLNQNDLLVFSDVRSGYEEFLAIVIQELSNKIFEHVPIDVLVPL